MPGPKVHSQSQRLGTKRARYTLASQYPGQSGYTDADEAQAHVRELMSLDLPARSIARAAGAHEETVLQLARGARTTIRTRRAAALFAVTHHPVPEQGRVIAIGACRRLRALAALGWSSGALAEHTWLSDKVLWSIMAGRHATTSYEIWEECRRLFELLSGTPGPSAPARSRAAVKGWPPPLDWDDELDIDDPRVTAARSGPPKVTERTRADDRRERAQQLLEAGVSVENTAARLGVTVRQVERYIREAKDAA